MIYQQLSVNRIESSGVTVQVPWVPVTNQCLNLLQAKSEPIYHTLEDPQDEPKVLIRVPDYQWQISV